MQDEVTEKMSQAWPAIVGAFTAELEGETRAFTFMTSMVDPDADPDTLSVTWPDADGAQEPTIVGDVRRLRAHTEVSLEDIGKSFSGVAALAQAAAKLERTTVLDLLQRGQGYVHIDQHADVKQRMEGLGGTWTLVVSASKSSGVVAAFKDAGLHSTVKVDDVELPKDALVVSLSARGPRLTRLGSADLQLSWRHRHGGGAVLFATQVLRFRPGTVLASPSAALAPPAPPSTPPSGPPVL